MGYSYVPIHINGVEVNDMDRKSRNGYDSDEPVEDNRRTLATWIYMRGFNKSSLARAIGVSRSTVTKWCNGQHVPNGMSLTRLCEVLDIDWNQVRATQASIYAETDPDDFRTARTSKKPTTIASRGRW